MDDAVRHVEGYTIRFNYTEVISAILSRGSFNVELLLKNWAYPLANAERAFRFVTN